jgi:hypothetical protein
MVLSTTKKASSVASITNQNQGGGNAKAGLAPQVGRSAWTSIAFGANGIPSGKCCKLSGLVRLNFTHYSRPIGSTVHVPYFKIV